MINVWLERLIGLDLKRWILPFKIIFTFILFYFIFNHANWQDIKLLWVKADISLLAVLIFVKFFGTFLGAWRWKLVLQMQKQNISLGKLLHYYLIGRFFNHFLPTMIGGDSYRVYKLSRTMDSMKHPLLSVLMDRIFGLFVFLSLGFISVLVSWKEWNEVSIVSFSISFPATVLFIILLVLLSSAALKQKLVEKCRLPQRVKQGIKEASAYLQNKKNFSLYLGSVILFYYVMILNYQVMFSMFHVEVQLLTLATTIMLTRTVAMIPISLNGFGLLDASFVYLISKAGVSIEVAVMVMALFRILEIAISLIGGVLYLYDHNFQSNREERV